MLNIEENIDLSRLSTFRMKSIARYFAYISDPKDIAEAYFFAESHAVSVVVLGGGSNTIFANPTIESLVIQISIKGFEKKSEEGNIAIFKCGAGEIWDDVVEKTVILGYSGLETLSAIPGFVGGTPVQNVGAYGQEVKNVIISLEAYDTFLGGFVTFLNEDCRFGYRDSIFKNEEKGRYVITEVNYKLEKKVPSVPNYPGVATYFESRGITKPSIIDIRNAIIEIRKSKLPDPKEVASVGSFFKNPIISKQKADELKEKFPNAVIFPVDNNECKIGAGWMLDTLGFRGKDFGHLSCYKGNAMVIVNNSNATATELAELILNIQNKVKETFDIDIEPEPVMVE